MKNLVNIKSAKLMTVEEMNKSQSSMAGKYLVAPWHFPYEVYQFDSLTPNKDKARQVARGDEYAGYMPDFEFKVKRLNNTTSYLDGHNGTKYFVFDDVKTAKQAVRDLNTLENVEHLKDGLEYRIEEIKKDCNCNKSQIPQSCRKSLENFMQACEVVLKEVTDNHKLLVNKLSTL